MSSSADSQAARLRIEPTRCDCHPETCSHWSYRLMVGDLQLTTGEKDECERLMGALLAWNTRPPEQAGAVDDAMVESVGKTLYRYWDDVNQQAKDAYRAKVRSALGQALGASP